MPRTQPSESPIRLVLASTCALTLAVTVVPSSLGASVSTLKHRQHRQVQLLAAKVGTVRFFHNHSWLLRRPATRPIALREVRRASIWVRVLRKELAETRAALTPKVVRNVVAAQPSWLVAAFMCIHSHEGSWTDSGAPYWGGLQFGWPEWQRFGSRFAPSADLASPSEQIAAGIAYWRVAGFNPWPNTARMCGLL